MGTNKHEIYSNHGFQITRICIFWIADIIRTRYDYELHPGSGNKLELVAGCWSLVAGRWLLVAGRSTIEASGAGGFLWR